MCAADRYVAAQAPLTGPRLDAYITAHQAPLAELEYENICRQVWQIYMIGMHVYACQASRSYCHRQGLNVMTIDNTYLTLSVPGNTCLTLSMPVNAWLRFRAVSQPSDMCSMCAHPAMVLLCLSMSVRTGRGGQGFLC